jgi:hypothetical protein
VPWPWPRAHSVKTPRQPSRRRQDSQPAKAPVRPKKATGSAPGNGNAESRGTRTSDQSAASQGVAKQKAYKGNTGKKADPGTACSTARPTNNGGVDCGTGGKGATPGKVPKKSAAVAKGHSVDAANVSQPSI